MLVRLQLAPPNNVDAVSLVSNSGNVRKAVMKRFEVGYPDEMIGVYSGDTAEQAIHECKEDMVANNFKPDTPFKERLKGLIAIEIDRMNMLEYSS